MSQETPSRFKSLMPLMLILLTAAFGIQTWMIGRLRREVRQSETSVPEETLMATGYEARFNSPGAPPAAQAQPLWSADAWNPFEEMERMREEMDAMFGRMLGGMNRRSEFDLFARPAMPRQPRMNVRETRDAYILTLEFPGAGHAEIRTEVRDGHLHVSARMRKDEENASNTAGRLTHIERHESRFQRTIPLPPDVDYHAMSSEYEDGVFRITLPRRQPGVHDTV
jgi:HSP20 family molecular chaperone IbpA